ncbi:hypothetical protein BR93DRAFT_924253 [Coniochaeta sp. PMI_546]|nr:hypothetical protein BR93DRAFT_924253 [Coniochaeta sp. PMI_546]
MVPVDLVAFDHLLIEDMLEHPDVLGECLKPVAQFRTRTFRVCKAMDLAPEAVVQFGRNAYY